MTRTLFAGVAVLTLWAGSALAQAREESSADMRGLSVLVGGGVEGYTYALGQDTYPVPGPRHESSPRVCERLHTLAVSRFTASKPPRRYDGSWVQGLDAPLDLIAAPEVRAE